MLTDLRGTSPLPSQTRVWNSNMRSSVGAFIHSFICCLFPRSHLWKGKYPQEESYTTINTVVWINLSNSFTRCIYREEGIGKGGVRKRERERERDGGKEKKGHPFLSPKSVFTIITANCRTSEWMSETESLISVSSVSRHGACQLCESLFVWRDVDERKCIWDILTVLPPPLSKSTTTVLCEDWDTMALLIFCLEDWVPAHCLNTSSSLCLRCYSSWNLHKSYIPFSDRPCLSNMCLL